MFLKAIEHVFIASLLVLVTGFAPATAATIPADLKGVLETAAPEDEIDVIAHLADREDVRTFEARHAPLLKNLRGRERRAVLRRELVTALRARAERTQTPLRELLRKGNASHIRSLWAINAIAFKGTAQLISELAVHPAIERMILDAVIPGPTITPSAFESAEWNIQRVGAPVLWSLGITGQDVVVAIVDTGVDPDHLSYNTRWRGGSNSWFDPNGQHPEPFDADGHGTGVTGVAIGGEFADASGLTRSIGVAPGAQWIGAKIFNDANVATMAGIHEGLGWLLDPDRKPRTDDAPDIVNNSWSFTAVHLCETEFQPDIQNLKAAGIAVVFAAGNYGTPSNLPSTDVSPGNYPESFSVGATTSADLVYYQSSRGPSACAESTFFPDVAAPGVNIITSAKTGGGSSPGATRLWTGTSFAAPHVSGAMALLMEAFGPDGVTVNQIECALRSAANDIDTPGVDYAAGHGLLRVDLAYENLLAGRGGGNLIVTDSAAPPDDLNISFVTTSVGAVSGPEEILISNSCLSGPLSVTGMTLGGMSPGEFVLDVNGGVNPCASADLVLEPGQGCTVAVTFNPASGGVKSGVIDIASDLPTVRVTLGGTGLDGDDDGDGSPNSVELRQGTALDVPDVYLDLKAGLNLVSLPIEFVTPKYSQDLGLGTELGNTILSISRLIPGAGETEVTTFSDGVGQGANFMLEPEEGYYLEMSQDTDILWQGKNISTPGITLGTGINLAGFQSTGTHTAYSLLTALGGSSSVSSVQRYNRETGSFETAGYRNNSHVGVDFPLERGQAYHLFMNAGTILFVLP